MPSCTSDPKGGGDSITAWSMVYSSVGGQYAQSGYGRYRYEGTQNREFAEYTSTACGSHFCDKEVNNTYGGDNIQYYSAYHVKAQGNQIEMWAGNLSIAATNYDPACTNNCPDNWPGPWYEQYNGETVNAGDDVPGSSGYKASFTSVSYQASKWTSGSYPSFTPVADYPNKNDASTEPYYCFENSGASSFNIWTSGTC